MKLKCLNNVKLLRALTANHILGTLRHILFQLLLALRLNPTLATVKMPPRIILAIPSERMAILNIQKLDTTLLALKIVTRLLMQDLIQAPARLVHGLELDAILVEVNTLCVGICV